jgi:hypothetical protein
MEKLIFLTGFTSFTGCPTRYYTHLNRVGIAVKPVKPVKKTLKLIV